MSAFEKELKQIKTVRKLRVDSLRRKQLKCALEKTRAAQQIDDSETHYEVVQQELIETERTSLQDLVGGGFVKVDRLVGFTKLQQRGVKKIKDSQKEIELAHLHYKEAQAKYQEASVAANVAEKKLLGLEEVLEHQLWK